MADTPDTAESIQADAVGRITQLTEVVGEPRSLQRIHLTLAQRDLDRYRDALIEARNYIGEPRTPFTKAIAEILDRGLAR